VPAAHCTHVCISSPSSANPGSHGIHEVVPIPGAMVPAGHMSQIVSRPRSDENFPFSHLWQRCTAPADVEYDPGGHSLHDMVSVSRKFPF
jgi:hypothetical protein